MMGAYFSICSLVFLLIFIVVFFLKRKVENIDTKIYGVILIVTLIGIIFDVLCFVLYKFGFDYNNFIYKTMAKLEFTYYFVWLISYWYYMISNIYLKKIGESFLNKLKSIEKTIILLIIVSTILSIVLPCEFIVDNNSIIPTGLSVSFSSIIDGLMIVVIFISAIINSKYIFNKKLVSLFILIFAMIFGITIQQFYPDLYILNFLITIVDMVLYFTIENPDVKMIEMLNEAKDQANRANNAKSEFLSSMSHEIRTPLNAIVGFSNGLIENDKLDSESKEDVNNIIMASDALLELVNGILDISKIEAGKLEIIDTYYSFPKIFDELVLLTKARLGEKPLEFKYSYDKSIPEYLYGDAARVKQVILNLLTNSVKYTNSGFIDFRIHSIIKGDIVRLIISVEDSGIGIKKENIDKLFGRFERLGVEKDTTVEGTGLGLAITKKLVEMMGGKIVVQSVYGKGSLFTISLDQKIVTGEELEKLKKEENSKEESATLIDATGKKVLVVDDNNLNLKVAERLLGAYKCNIECITSGFECIEKITSGEKYDLILLDDMMPKMSGKETFDKLKEIPEFSTPIVALTANAISGMKEEYLKYGFNDYLSKPIEKAELNRVMKKYLR